MSVDIHTLKETVIESLSPLLRDLEDRSQIVEIRASPSGQFLAVITGNADSPNRYRHDLISGQSELMMGSLNQHAWNQGVLSWMPHERGWIEWDWIDAPDQPSLSLKGSPFSKPGSTTESSPLLRWPEGSLPWILHAPVMTEQGPFLLAHAFGDPSMPASNTFTLRLESIAPDHLLPNSKTCFGAGATRNTFQMDQGSTLRKWSAVDGSFRTHSIPSKVALHTEIPLREKGLEIPTTRDGRSSRSGYHKGDRSELFDVSGSMASQHNR